MVGVQANDLEPRHIGRVLSGRAVLVHTDTLTGPSASMAYLHGRLAWVAVEEGNGAWVVLGVDNLAAPVYVPADALVMIEADDENDDDWPWSKTCVGCNGAQIMAGHRTECPDHIPTPPPPPPAATTNERRTP